MLTRRQFVLTGAAALAGRNLLALPLQSRPRPSASQLQWQRDELAMFLHFGVNTFTDREWGDGTESPTIFNPARLDARQWARTAKAAGFRAMILTAKHHDGFCLWPTRTTKHSVASSPFRGGQGDVVREFVDACRAENLRPGVYLSPWDRNNPLYGDSPRYNDLYADQLTELLKNYGAMAEVWFDGANGEGPNGKKQQYDWPRVWGLVRQLQPEAVMFSDSGPDVRWCGNERGSAGDPNWSTVNPDVVPYPGASGPAIIPALQHGDPKGTVWRPAEADVSIRPGWFYHPAEDGRVKTGDRLLDIYCQSVGRNSKLLLNVPPTRDGLIHDADVASLTEFRAKREALFRVDTKAKRADFRRLDTSWVATVDLSPAITARAIRLEENIERGQNVAKHVVSYFPPQSDVGLALADSTTIGHARIHRLEKPVSISMLHVRVTESVARPEPLTIKIYSA